MHLYPAAVIRPLVYYMQGSLIMTQKTPLGAKKQLLSKTESSCIIMPVLLSVLSFFKKETEAFRKSLPRYKYKAPVSA